jgi:hypothetical protein
MWTFSSTLYFLYPETLKRSNVHSLFPSHEPPLAFPLRCRIELSILWLKEPHFVHLLFCLYILIPDRIIKGVYRKMGSRFWWEFPNNSDFVSSIQRITVLERQATVKHISIVATVCVTPSL